VLAEALQAADALEASWPTDPEEFRYEALAALATEASVTDNHQLMIALMDTMDAASDAPRSSALDAARRSVRLTAKLGGPSGVEELRRAIVDVCRWYP
jgi:hypothetical protein